jgi:hypothetical protein
LKSEKEKNKKCARSKKRAGFNLVRFAVYPWPSTKAFNWEGRYWGIGTGNPNSIFPASAGRIRSAEISEFSIDPRGIGIHHKFPGRKISEE